jgi:hypothetical protein
MANTVTFLLILAVALRSIDFSALTWLDGAILALAAADVALGAGKKYVEWRASHGRKK